jgi:hypothetical protein
MEQHGESGNRGGGEHRGGEHRGGGRDDHKGGSDRHR